MVPSLRPIVPNLISKRHLPQPKISINHEFCNPQPLSAPRGNSRHDFLPVILKHTQFKVPTPVVPKPDQSVHNFIQTPAFANTEEVP
jgi:hypothetical protein